MQFLVYTFFAPLRIGLSAMADISYAIPLPQPSEPPENVTLEAIDGNTLRVGFRAPASTGGEEVDR